MAIPSTTLGDSGLSVSRLGVGLAAVARPGYITLGRARDLPQRSVDALYQRCADILDAARAAGVRYVDVARSYGRAEEFVARWLRERAIAPGAMTIGSKWGYHYTAAWQVDAPVHEQKELSLARFTSQLAESRALLGAHLALYQIHSATAESGVLDDAALLRALVDGRRRDAYRAIGLTLTGAAARRTLERAVAAEVAGERVFDVVHATFNILEPSLREGLAAAHAAGLGVILKEVHANGRLTPANDRSHDQLLHARLDDVARRCGLAVDQLAMAFAAGQPWCDVVLSGAATVAQLASHVASSAVALDAATLDELATLAEPPATYWQSRASLAWS